jgi:excisionase family DNA binding protein
MRDNNLAVAVLSKDEIHALIHQAASAVIADLREELERPRTPELMTKHELAEYLRCDVSKVNRYMKEGLPFEMFGSHPRFRKSDIDAWLKDERIQKIQRKAA